MEEEKKSWYSYNLKLMECGEFPKNASKKERMLIRSFAKRFFIFNGVLYKRDKVMHLRGVSKKRSRTDYTRCAFRDDMILCSKEEGFKICSF